MLVFIVSLFLHLGDTLVKARGRSCWGGNGSAPGELPQRLYSRSVCAAGVAHVPVVGALSRGLSWLVELVSGASGALVRLAVDGLDSMLCSVPTLMG